MRCIVSGTDQETGQAIELTVEAVDVSSAAAMATKKGVTVASVRSVDPAPPPMTKTQAPPTMPTQPPTMPTRRAMTPPAGPAKKKGVRLWLAFVLLIAAFFFPIFPSVPLWAGIAVLGVVTLFIFPLTRQAVGSFLRVSPERPWRMAFKLTAFVLIGVGLIGLSAFGRAIAREIEAVEAKQAADRAAKAQAEAAANSQVVELVERSKTALIARDVLSAHDAIDGALKVSLASNRGLAAKLQAAIKNSDDPDWALSVLVHATDADFDAFKDGGAVPASLELGYAVLTEKAVANAKSQISVAIPKRAETKKQEAEAAEARRQREVAAAAAAKAKAAAEAEARAKEARKALVEQQFSVWDGSHPKFVEKVKGSMNDPDSFVHVETRYVDMGDYLFITMKFRGKNRFGGVVTNTAIGKVDLKGNVMEVANLGE